MTAITPVQFQPPEAAAPFAPSAWDLLVGDPSFLIMNLVAIFIVILLAWLVRRRYGRFYTLQREAFDHRKSADARVLAQQQTFEQMISQQYGITNAHNEQIAAKAEEALRLNAETLAQISAMNRTLTRIAERLEQAGG